MKVWLNKKTGDLSLAVKVMLVDGAQEIYALSGYSITLGDQFGWIIHHPEMGVYWIFFNKQCEKWFEDLGEL